MHMPIVTAGQRSPIVFVTVCTKDRKPVLANPDIHKVLRAAWKLAPNWNIGRYMIMPDHVHLFCAPASNPPASIYEWIEFWKGSCARAVKGYGPLAGLPGGTAATPSEGMQSGRGGSRPSRPELLWQRDCWDTQLRRGDSYSLKWEYVRNNPVRAGLVSSSDEWPYQGEMNALEWHDI